MPHFVVEYTSNLRSETDIPAFLQRLNMTAIGLDGLFPLGGIRSRAVELEDYCIADGTRDAAFVHVTIKIGRGRTEDQKARICDALFDAVKSHFGEVFDRRPLALSLELVELNDPWTRRHNNLHKLFGSTPRDQKVPAG